MKEGGGEGRPGLYLILTDFLTVLLREICLCTCFFKSFLRIINTHLWTFGESCCLIVRGGGSGGGGDRGGGGGAGHYTSGSRSHP